MKAGVSLYSSIAAFMYQNTSSTTGLYSTKRQQMQLGNEQTEPF